MVTLAFQGGKVEGQNGMRGDIKGEAHCPGSGCYCKGQVEVWTC